MSKITDREILTPKKEYIVEQAAKLFEEKGYSAASMRDLAERVNLKVSSLYSHIKSKDDILRLICFRNAERFHDGITRIEESGESTLQKIEAIIRLHLDLALNYPTSVTVFNDEWRHLQQPYLSFFMELRRSYEMRVRLLIEKGMQEGLIAERDPNLSMYTLFSALRWLHYSQVYRNHPHREDHANQILDFIMNGLKR